MQRRPAVGPSISIMIPFLFLPLVGEVKIPYHRRDTARNSGPHESLGKGASESIGTSVVPVGVGAKGSGDQAQQFKLHVEVDQK